jgi:FkbM family methyltransferase
MRETLTKIKYRIRNLITGGIKYPLVHKCNARWYGSSYGGFFVHPDVLTKKSVVYSFGIGEDISFDEAIIKRHNCEVFGFDPTPKSINWIKAKKDLPQNFHFFDYGVDTQTHHVTFYLPKNEAYVSGSLLRTTNVSESAAIEVPMKKYSDIVSELQHSQIDVLKMDIEGSEYAVVEDILNGPVEIKQLLIEIHERFFPDGKEKTEKLFKVLHQNGYALFGKSDSNEELSFIKLN